MDKLFLSVYLAIMIPSTLALIKLLLEMLRDITEWSKCKFYTISLGGFSLLVALIYCLL